MCTSFFFPSGGVRRACMTVYLCLFVCQCFLAIRNWGYFQVKRLWGTGYRTEHYCELYFIFRLCKYCVLFKQRETIWWWTQTPWFIPPLHLWVNNLTRSCDEFSKVKLTHSRRLDRSCSKTYWALWGQRQVMLLYLHSAVLLLALLGTLLSWIWKAGGMRSMKWCKQKQQDTNCCISHTQSFSEPTKPLNSRHSQ